MYFLAWLHFLLDKQNYSGRYVVTVAAGVPQYQGQQQWFFSAAGVYAGLPH